MDDQDWQFKPAEFERIARMVGGFTLDAASDVEGRNAFCVPWCSARDPFERKSLTDERVWANFPFRHLEKLLLHYFAQKEANPSIMGCFVVPVWKKASWWPLIEKLEVLAHYPAGSDLFTTAVVDGSRKSVGPTRWAVEIRYDPRDGKPDRHVGCDPTPVYARTEEEVIDAAAVASVVSADAADLRPHAPAFWRLTVDDSGTSRSPVGSRVEGVHQAQNVFDKSPVIGTLQGRTAPLSRPLHVRGRAAGGAAIVLLDSRLNEFSCPASLQKNIIRKHNAKRTQTKLVEQQRLGAAQLERLCLEQPIHRRSVYKHQKHRVKTHSHAVDMP